MIPRRPDPAGSRQSLRSGHVMDVEGWNAECNTFRCRKRIDTTAWGAAGDVLRGSRLASEGAICWTHQIGRSDFITAEIGFVAVASGAVGSTWTVVCPRIRYRVEPHCRRGSVCCHAPAVSRQPRGASPLTFPSTFHVNASCQLTGCVNALNWCRARSSRSR